MIRVNGSAIPMPMPIAIPAATRITHNESHDVSGLCSECYPYTDLSCAAALTRDSLKAKKNQRCGGESEYA